MQLPVSSDLQWTLTRDGSFVVCGRTVRPLPPGAYTLSLDHCGECHYKPHPLNTDDLIEFPASVSAGVLAEVERFWSMGDRFARLGFAHRRGYLFYGKQGCGKSSLIHQLIGRIVGAGHVAFFCAHPAAFRITLARFREVEPGRPVVCVFEDIDATIKYYGDSELLQLLDGNAQVDKVVNLASTNYPERLDRRIIARPRRFDRLIKIGSPDAALREAFFAKKLPFAGLSELIISVECLGHDLEAAAAALHELDRHTPSSDQFGGANGEPLADVEPNGEAVYN
jgi:hypothetical protein